MKSQRRIIGIIAAVLLAGVGTYSLVTYVQSTTDEAIADEELVEVYVIDQFVAKGTPADALRSAVAVEEIPARLVQAGAITDLDALGDEVAASDLQPGDQLVEARLSARDVVLSEIADKVQISARLDAERAVGGAIRKGDLVGVYMSFDPFEVDEAGAPEPSPADPTLALAGGDPMPSEDGASPDGGITPGETDTPAEATADGAVAESDGPDKTPNVSRLEFQQILVTNVQTVNPPVVNRSDDDEESEAPEINQVTGTQYVVTLAMSPEQSERFVFGTEFGHVWLSIQPATVDDDGTRPVTLGNVYSVIG